MSGPESLDPFRQRFLTEDDRADILARYLVSYRRRGWKVVSVDGHQAQLQKRSLWPFMRRQKMLLYVNDIGDVEHR